ncbi:MAG: hypothetical protein NTW10_06680 [Bacteroidetes bacterium]|nr:hypothetical protein [Bacteroidota bacterium]MCX6306424.1 hypothetical protein [Bacteroidota bacterium]
MKKLLTFFAVLICIPFILKSQSVEVTPFGGYVFPGTLNADGGDVRFLGNAQYGGMISIGVSRVMDVDLIYNRIDTKADVNIYSWNNSYNYDQVPLSINYMMIGFTKNFRVNPTVSPFIGFNLGATLFYPKEDAGKQYQEAWFFAMGMNGGAKVYFSKRVGLRLQAQLLLPVQGAGFYMFAGTGGSGGGVSVYSTLVQFGFTGGLIFRLGHIQ